MLYTILADLVLPVHLAYVAFALIGQLLILAGLALRWPWVRNLRFRVIHLVMVEAVALEGLFGIRCPLTDIEDAMRHWGRGETYSGWTMTAPAVPRPPMIEEVEFRDWQPVAFQSEVAAPAMPEAEPAPEAKAEAASPDTFVGRILGSILYVQVDQKVLDQWYVAFGLFTLAVFVAFPPRLGAWTRLGFVAMTTLWIGGLFFAAAYYDWVLGHSVENAYPPLVTGLALLALGGVCGFQARRRGHAKAETQVPVSPATPPVSVSPNGAIVNSQGR